MTKSSILDVLHSWDVNITKRWGICATRDSYYGVLRPYMKMLEISCHGILWIACTLGLVFIFSSTAVSTFLTNLFISILFDILVILIIKAAVRRPRPAANNMDMPGTVFVDVYSFPSGHSSRASMLFFIFLAKGPFNVIINLFIFLWSLMICFSRVLLGRHHVGDVICGMILGYFEYICMLWLWLSGPSCKMVLNMLMNTSSSGNEIEL